MKKLFAFLLIFLLAFTGCLVEDEETEKCSCLGRPAMLYNGTHYVNPHIPLKELPEGYEYAGIVSEEMGHKTGNKDMPYYVKEGADDFYTYQMTGTYIGGNTVDNTKQAMHYIQWIPVENE